MVIFCIFLSFVATSAQHDHSVHMGEEQMINEIGVMVKKTQPELIKEINSYKLTLQHMEYEIDQCKEDDED